jgi:hypothetical protein
MKMNTLTIANALSDQDLLSRLQAVAGREREASAELVAHLAALDSRPSLYAAQGYGSLFTYCTQALRLSEDAACTRIEAARACRRFPVILELLVSGELSLTAVRRLGRHLTVENHRDILARAKRRSREQIEVLVAELAPRPDVPTSVRTLPASSATPFSAAIPAEAPTAMPAESSPTRCAARGVLFGIPADRPADGAGALSGAVHDRAGDPREAAAPAGTSAPRDPGRRSSGHLRPSPLLAPPDRREQEAGGNETAASPTAYPSWDG